MQYASRWITWLTHPLVMLGYMAVVIWAYITVDQPLALHLHALNLSERYPILVWITQLGRSLVYLALVPLVAVFFRYIRRSKQTEARLWFLWGTLVITNGACFVLKTFLGRARPELLFESNIFGFYGYHANSLYHSFPSGHVTLVTTAVLSLTLLFPRLRWVFLVTGMVVVATRVLLTYHYLSDVLATMYLVVLEYRFLMYIVSHQCPLYWVRLRLDL